MAINVIKWNEANIKWNDNPHLWNLVQEIIAEVEAGGKNWKKRDKDKEKRKKWSFNSNNWNYLGDIYTSMRTSRLPTIDITACIDNNQ